MPTVQQPALDLVAVLVELNDLNIQLWVCHTYIVASRRYFAVQNRPVLSQFEAASLQYRVSVSNAPPGLAVVARGIFHDARNETTSSVSKLMHGMEFAAGAGDATTRRTL
jgi:hypothetical protein